VNPRSEEWGKEIGRAFFTLIAEASEEGLSYVESFDISDEPSGNAIFERAASDGFRACTAIKKLVQARMAHPTEFYLALEIARKAVEM